MGVTLSELGGAQKVVFDLLSGLPEDRFDVTLVCAPGGELLRWVERLNQGRSRKVEIQCLPSLCREIRPLRDLWTLLSLVRIFRKTRPDLAHFHSSKMGLLGRLAAKIAKVPCIFTVHGWGIRSTGSLLKRDLLSGIERWAGSLAHAVVCVCKYDRHQGVVQGLTRTPGTRVIYNGIDAGTKKAQEPGALRRLLGIRKDMPLFGFVGRLVDAKHPELLIRSAAALREMGVERFRLVIIGDGPKKRVVGDLIRRLDLESHVYFLGSRDDAPALMPDLDGLLLLSRYESFPLVVLEAMQAGVPVVATRVGGVPEQVVDGLTGYLVQPDPRTVASRMAALIQDPDLGPRMGRVAQEYVTRFSVDDMVRRYQEVYRQVLEGGGA